MRWIRMLNLGLVALCALVCCSLVACGGDEQPAAPAASQADAPASESPVESEANSKDPAATTTGTGLSEALTTLLAGIAAEERSKTNPLSGQSDAIAAGRSEYMSMCFVCHGAEGKGDGPASKATPTIPSDLSDATRAALLSDADRFAVMRNGIPGTSMPASGANLNDTQIWRILAYVETLSQQ